MTDDLKSTRNESTMNIDDELAVLTGHAHTPVKVRNRLKAARLIAQNVLGNASEAAVLAVFDQLRIAADLEEPEDDPEIDRELH